MLVAEYRPDSRSIIYRIDPQTMAAREVFRAADHIGAIVHNTDDQTLHGVSLADARSLHQVPVALWTAKGLDMTQNPSWFEATAAGLRAYFMPEDNSSTLYVFEVETEH